MARPIHRREEVESLLEKMKNVKDSRFGFGCDTANEVLRIFAREPERVETELEHTNRLAENIRGVAGEQEGILRGYKEPAMELGKLYRKIKGTRDWGPEEVEAIPEEWLPSSLRREEILRRIRSSRAHVELTSDGRLLLLFEDGGVMELKEQLEE